MRFHFAEVFLYSVLSCHMAVKTPSGALTQGPLACSLTSRSENPPFHIEGRCAQPDIRHQLSAGFALLVVLAASSGVLLVSLLAVVFSSYGIAALACCARRHKLILC
jgi:hypothetical protein